MTDLEKIYRYLNGQLSNQSFRKYLLNSDSLTSIFKEDSDELRRLADKFSLTIKMREIIERHINKEDFDKFTIRTAIQDAKKNYSDPVEIVYVLASLTEFIKADKLTKEIKKLNSYVMHIPPLTQQQLWNEDSFKERRLFLKDLEPIINNVIMETLKYTDN